MNIEEDVFEIVDHTCSSAWEKFIFSIENLLENWQLNNNTSKETDYYTFFGSNSNQVFEILSFCDTSYLLTFYFSSPRVDELPEEKILRESQGNFRSSKEQLFGDDETPKYIQQQLGDEREDFRPDCHFLHRWFGLKEMLILTPSSDDVYISQTEARRLLSSLCIAAQNQKSSVAVFVPIGHQSENVLIGSLIDEGVEVRFHTSKLQIVPTQYNHLSGLADFFSSKLDPTRPLTILNSACFTYSLSNWYDDHWKRDSILPKQSNLSLKNVGHLKFLFGPNIDPFENFNLSVHWPEFPQDAVLDNNVYSELDPTEAPLWCLTKNFRSKFNQPITETLLIVISTFMLANNLHFDFKSSLKDGKKSPVIEVVGSTFNHAIRRNNTTQTSEHVQSVLKFLFEQPFESEKDFYDVSLLKELGLPLPSQLNPIFGKVCEKGSLTWLIALHIANEIHDPEMKSLAIFWNEVIREIRFHWEQGKNLSRVTKERPDFKYTLLNQKFQMLNYCISKKIQAQGIQRNSNKKDFKELFDVSASKIDSDDEDNEDIFYDTIDSMSLDDVSKNKEKKKEKEKENLPDIEGRVGYIKPLGLDKFCQNGRLLYIPETQEPKAMTEDMLEEQQKVFEGLGSTLEGTQKRQKLQTTELLSDMRSFQAANPDSVLEDFVQWYSPRDWIPPKDGAKSSLSQRMNENGNLWKTTWMEATPIPAKDQELLFDYVKEGEKVLHYLENMFIDSLLEQTIPTLFLIIYDSFLSSGNLIKFKPIRDLLSQFHSKIGSFPWQDIRTQQEPLKELITLVQEIEYLMTIGASISHKFPQQFDLVERLLLKDSTILILQAERDVVQDLFQSQDNETTSPDSREFILRTLAPNPNPSSRNLTHRLYALLAKNEFRVIESFSFDVLYF